MDFSHVRFTYMYQGIRTLRIQHLLFVVTMVTPRLVVQHLYVKGMELTFLRLQLASVRTNSKMLVMSILGAGGGEIT